MLIPLAIEVRIVRGNWSSRANQAADAVATIRTCLALFLATADIYKYPKPTSAIIQGGSRRTLTTRNQTFNYKVSVSFGLQIRLLSPVSGYESRSTATSFSVFDDPKDKQT